MDIKLTKKATVINKKKVHLKSNYVNRNQLKLNIRKSLEAIHSALLLHFKMQLNCLVLEAAIGILCQLNIFEKRRPDGTSNLHSPTIGPLNVNSFSIFSLKRQKIKIYTFHVYRFSSDFSQSVLLKYNTYN